MAPTGGCSECGGPLKNPAARTCSDSCRGKRSRRIKRQRSQAGKNHANPPHLEHLAKVTDDADLAREVAKEELRPLVREAITEDVLRAAQRLVSLTPAMVDAIEEDLQSQDKILRQKAYSLLARYTLGNHSIAPPPAEQAPQPMQVVFNLPRPGSHNEAEQEAVVAATEIRDCVECKDTKPVHEFVGASDRCAVCHDALQAAVAARFAPAE